MKAFERLKQAAQVFKQALPEGSGLFDNSSPECQEADRLLQMGSYAEAEAIFGRVAADGRFRGSGRRQQTRVLWALATAQWKQNKLDDAERNVSAARAHIDDPKKASSELVDCLDLQGRIAQQRGDLGTAENLLSNALETHRRQKNADPAITTELQRRLSSVLIDLARREDARSLLREALTIAEGQCGEYTRVTADCLMDLSHCEAGLGRYAEARELAERALKIHRDVCGTDSAETGQDLEALAGFCQSGKDFEAAVSYLEQALFVRERQIGGNAAQFALLLMALADIHTLLGRLAPALELMQQAVTKLSPSRDENLATALEKLGSIYFRTGRPENALDCYQNARQYWELRPEANSEALDANGRFLAELSGLISPSATSTGRDAAEQADDGRSVLLPDPNDLSQDNAEPVLTGFPATIDLRTEPVAPPIQPAATVLHTTSVPQVIPAEAKQAPTGIVPKEWKPITSQMAPASGNGVQVTFKRADGSTIDPPPGDPAAEPVQLTVVVGDEAQPAAGRTVIVANSATPDPEPQLSGWDDLAFDAIEPSGRP